MKFTQARVHALKPPPGKADHEVIDGAMAGFGVRYRNGGPGNYFIKFRVGKKDGRMSLGAVAKVTLADAQAAARRHFAAIAEKINPAIQRAKAVARASDSIEPLLDAFLAHQRRNGRAESYLRDVTRSLRVYFRPLLAFAAADIGRAMVAKELARLRSECGSVTADRARAHISKFFSWTIAEGLAELNPVTGTTKNVAKARDRLLRDEEIAAIWDALGDDDYGDVCRLLVLTGARKTEIGALRRDEINFAQAQIELPGSRTKAGIAHVIPLSDLAHVILEKRAPRPGSDFVFGRAQGGFGGWSKAKARLNARLEIEPWTLHDFRRYLSTTLHDRLDAPPHIVESILGHISGHKAGVSGTYNRSEYSTQKRKFLTKYAEHIKGLTRPRLTLVG